MGLAQLSIPTRNPEQHGWCTAAAAFCGVELIPCPPFAALLRPARQGELD